MSELKERLVPLCMAAAIVLICLHKGGLEEIDQITARIQRRLSYWIYKFSLWKDTEIIRRSYRYLTCKFCGHRYRIEKKQNPKLASCPNCNCKSQKKRKDRDYERSKKS